MRGHSVMLQVLVHLRTKRFRLKWEGLAQHYTFLFLAHNFLDLLLPLAHDLLPLLVCKDMTLDGVNWLDVKIVLLQSYHPVFPPFTQLLLNK